MEPDQVDLAATALGVVEKGAELGSHRVEAGDVVIGLASPNLRSNGFSLVRTVVGDRDLRGVSRRSLLIDLLMEPSVIYSPAVMQAVATGKVHAAAHITGGGLIANLTRVIPAGCQVDDRLCCLATSAGLSTDGGVGRRSTCEMRAVLNMGIGFCLVVAPDDAEESSNSRATTPGHR